MKTTTFIATTAAFLAFSLSGCDNEMSQEAGPIEGKSLVMTLQAATDGPQTRMDYTEDAANQKMLFSWRKDDPMSVVVEGVSGNENCLLTADDDGKGAEFNGTATEWGDEEKKIYAIYPYNSTAYTIKNSGTAEATVALTLPNPQPYTISESTTTTAAMTNSFMVGTGTATLSGTTIDASARMKQVMSIIKLNITNAPAQVTEVSLMCEKKLATEARVMLSDATVSYTTSNDHELFMEVTDPTSSSTKAVSFAIFPFTNEDFKPIIVKVTFADGKVKMEYYYQKEYKRNTHYVINVDASQAAEPKPYITVNGITVATGNLIGNGMHGCKIGEPTDGGLYFMFGSLIGWAGGKYGYGTGFPKDDLANTGYSYNTTYVIPKGEILPIAFSYTPYWKDAGDVPAKYDPCTYYLGSPWRLPTINEYKTLFGDKTSDKWEDFPDWSWDNATHSVVHTSGLRFPAPGSRQGGVVNGKIKDLYDYSFYWTSSSVPEKSNFGSNIAFYLKLGEVNLAGESLRDCAFPVRCVRDNPTPILHRKVKTAIK